MSRLFDIVRELSGQASAISIPRPYIRLCKGNHTHAAVLSQLVFWSSTKSQGEWFYKSNKELGAELELEVHQVRYALDQLKKRLGDVLQVKRKKANGVPTNHYLLDGDKLVELLFPVEDEDSQMEETDFSNGSENIDKPECENSHFPGSANILTSINRSKPYTNKQILNVTGEPDTGQPEDPVLFEIPLKGKSKTYPVKQSEVTDLGVLYPAVDVPQQLRNMIGWCMANPTRQKTSRGVSKFIHGWLCREQDRGYAGRPPVNQSISEINQDTSWIDDMEPPFSGDDYA